MILPPLLSVAAKTAEHSSYKHRLGAVIEKHSKVLSKAYNTFRKHRFSYFYDYPESLHAEAHAVLRFRGDTRKLVGSTLYVARINKHGTTRLAKPCECCQAVLKAVGIREVIYTTNEGFSSLKLEGGS